VRPLVTQLRALAGRHRLALGGAGAENGALEANGLLAHTGDPIAAATNVTTLVQVGAPR
jgi:hypothetical protein